MNKTTTTTPQAPANGVSSSENLDPEVLAFRANFESRSPLDEIIREGARRMLQAAIETEVEDFISTHSQRCDEQGLRQVVRNGHFRLMRYSPELVLLKSGNLACETNQRTKKTELSFLRVCYQHT